MGPEGRLPNTLSELLITANKLGHTLKVRYLSPDELVLLPLPAIVHVDGDSPSGGTFLLLLQIQAKTVIFMNGPSATINSLSREDFFRKWSGVTLFSVSNADHCALELISGMVIGLSTAAYLKRKYQWDLVRSG